MSADDIKFTMGIDLNETRGIGYKVTLEDEGHTGHNIIKDIIDAGEEDAQLLGTMFFYAIEGQKEFGLDDDYRVEMRCNKRTQAGSQLQFRVIGTSFDKVYEFSRYGKNYEAVFAKVNASLQIHLRTKEEGMTPKVFVIPAASLHCELKSTTVNFRGHMIKGDGSVTEKDFLNCKFGDTYIASEFLHQLECLKRKLETEVELTLHQGHTKTDAQQSDRSDNLADDRSSMTYCDPGTTGKYQTGQIVIGRQEIQVLALNTSSMAVRSMASCISAEVMSPKDAFKVGNVYLAARDAAKERSFFKPYSIVYYAKEHQCEIPTNTCFHLHVMADT